MLSGKNKKIRNATGTTYDNIQFKSKLEAYTYQQLIKEGYTPEYEGRTFTLVPSFQILDTISYYHRSTKLPKHLVEDLRKIRSMTYTPDFIVVLDSYYIVYDVKGFRNDTYPLKKKLFFKWVKDNEDDFDGKKVIFFEPSTRAEVNQSIEIIKTLQEN